MLDGLLLKRREKRLLVLGVGKLDRARQDIHVLIGLTHLATALLVRLDDEERLVSLGEHALALDDLGAPHIGANAQTPTRKTDERLVDAVNVSDLSIDYFFHELDGKKKLKGAEYYIAVPTDITEVEKRAYFDLITNTNLKPKKIHVVEKPVADALGMNLDITKSTGTLVVDIGANTTEISVMSLGGIVLSRLIPIGGNRIGYGLNGLVNGKMDEESVRQAAFEKARKLGFKGV